MAETKQSIVGIAIPEECGKADMYEITAILYHDDNSDADETEYQVFITKEDFEKSTPFATIKANMNPEILLYPDEEHEGMGFLQYDLVESERVDTTGDINAIVVSEIVDDSDTKWIMHENDYTGIEAKFVRMNDEEITVE